MRRRDAAVGIVLFAATLAFCRASRVDQMTDATYSLLLSANLLEHGDFELDRYRIQGPQYQLESVHGHQYYSYPPATSVLSVPYMAIMKRLGKSPVGNDGNYDLAAERSMQLTLAAILVAGFVTLVFFTARLLLAPARALLVAVVTGTGTQALSTASRAMWSETWALVFIGASVFVLLRAAAAGRSPNGVVLATLEVWAYLVRPTNSIALAATAIYLALTNRKVLISFAPTCAAWIGLFVLYSWSHFGTVVPHYFAYRPQFHHFWSGLAGILISPNRGILITVPAVVALGLLLYRHRQRLRFRPLAALAAGIVITHLILISGWDDWWGGWCFGARLCTGLVPWFALLATLGLDAAARDEVSRALRPSAQFAINATLIALCVASIAINCVGAFSWEAQKWNAGPTDVGEKIWDWSRPQFLAPFIEPPGSFLPIPPAGLGFGSAADAYLGFGWSGSEGDFRWTDGDSATFRFAQVQGTPVKDARLEITLVPYLQKDIPRQRIRPKLNGHLLAPLEITAQQEATYALPLPAEYLKRDNVLKLGLPDAASPARNDPAGDTRVLAIAIRRIQLVVTR
jgi:hypothetical protein